MKDRRRLSVSRRRRRPGRDVWRLPRPERARHVEEERAERIAQDKLAAREQHIEEAVARQAAKNAERITKAFPRREVRCAADPVGPLG